MLLIKQLLIFITVSFARSSVVQRTYREDGTKEFIIVREIRENQCKCTCSCKPIESDATLTKSTMETASSQQEVETKAFTETSAENTHNKKDSISDDTVATLEPVFTKESDYFTSSTLSTNFSMNNNYSQSSGIYTLFPEDQGSSLGLNMTEKTTLSSASDDLGNVSTALSSTRNPLTAEAENLSTDEDHHSTGSESRTAQSNSIKAVSTTETGISMIFNHTSYTTENHQQLEVDTSTQNPLNVKNKNDELETSKASISPLVSSSPPIDTEIVSTSPRNEFIGTTFENFVNTFNETDLTTLLSTISSQAISEELNNSGTTSTTTEELTTPQAIGSVQESNGNELDTSTSSRNMDKSTLMFENSTNLLSTETILPSESPSADQKEGTSTAETTTHEKTKVSQTTEGTQLEGNEKVKCESGCIGDEEKIETKESEEESHVYYVKILTDVTKATSRTASVSATKEHGNSSGESSTTEVAMTSSESSNEGANKISNSTSEDTLEDSSLQTSSTLNTEENFNNSASTSVFDDSDTITPDHALLDWQETITTQDYQPSLETTSSLPTTDTITITTQDYQSSLETTSSLPTTDTIRNKAEATATISSHSNESSSSDNKIQMSTVSYTTDSFSDDLNYTVDISNLLPTEIQSNVTETNSLSNETISTENVKTAEERMTNEEKSNNDKDSDIVNSNKNGKNQTLDEEDDMFQTVNNTTVGNDNSLEDFLEDLDEDSSESLEDTLTSLDSPEEEISSVGEPIPNTNDKETFVDPQKLWRKMEEEKAILKLREAETQRFLKEEQQRLKERNVMQSPISSSTTDFGIIEEKQLLEKARKLREEQRKLEWNQELSREAAMKTEIERQKQINRQLEVLAEIERRQREILESEKLLLREKSRRVGFDISPGIIRPGFAISREALLRSKLEKSNTNSYQTQTSSQKLEVTALPPLSHKQCEIIRRFIQVVAMSSPSEWVKTNCSFAKRYFPRASCSNIQKLFESCL